MYMQTAHGKIELKLKSKGNRKICPVSILSELWLAVQLPLSLGPIAGKGASNRGSQGKQSIRTFARPRRSENYRKSFPI